MAQEPGPVSILVLCFPLPVAWKYSSHCSRQTQEQHPQFWFRCARRNGFEGPQLDSVLIQNTAQCWRNEESKFKLMGWCFAQLLLKGASGVHLMECVSLCVHGSISWIEGYCVHCRDPVGKAVIHFHPHSQCSWKSQLLNWLWCFQHLVWSFWNWFHKYFMCARRTKWTLRRIDSTLALLQNLITLILQKFICVLQCWC